MTTSWSRRRVLGTAGAAALGAATVPVLGGGAAATEGAATEGAAAEGAAPAGAAPAGAPAFVPTDRPVLTHGVQSGDAVASDAVTSDAVSSSWRTGRAGGDYGGGYGGGYGRGGAANVWTRADRPGRMLVEVSTRPDFRHATRLRGPAARPGHRLHRQAAAARPARRPHASTTGYGWRAERRPRQRAADRLADASPAGATGVRFVWTGGHRRPGLGHQPRRRRHAHLRGDAARASRTSSCAAATPCTPTARSRESVTLPDGRVWRNVTTPEKSKVAETLAEYRGQYAYNLLDAQPAGVRWPRCRRSTSGTTTRSPTTGTRARSSTDARYTEKRVDVLAARARQAFYEWLPIAPGPALPAAAVRAAAGRVRAGHAHLQGPQRRQRVRRPGARPARRAAAGLADPRAAPLPGHLEGHRRSTCRSAWSCRTARPRRRASRRATRARRWAGSWSSPRCCATAHRHGVTGIVFLTADVHYTAAHHYDPARAAVGDFTPFWEFVSGPANAGAFGPNRAGRHVRAAGGVRARPAARPTPRRWTASSTSARSTSTARAGR